METVSIAWHDQAERAIRVSRLRHGLYGGGRVSWVYRPVVLRFRWSDHPREERWLIEQMRRPVGLEFWGEDENGRRLIGLPPWRSRDYTSPANWVRRIVDAWVWGTRPVGDYWPGQLPLRLVIARRHACRDECLEIAQ